VRLPLKASALQYWDAARGSFEVEPDQVSVMVGSSSADIRVKKSVEVE
jgi:fibronectin type III domain protein